MISQELQLDASPAEAVIQDVGAALEAVAATFKSGLDDALAVLAQPIDVTVVADTATAETEIVALADIPPVDVPVSADTETARTEIDGLHDVPPVEIPVEADTANAEQDFANLGSAATEAGSGVDSLSGSVSGLGAAIGVSEGSAKELVGVLGEMGGEAGTAAAGGVLALGAATGGFFEEGLKAVSAGQRFDLVLGDMAEKMKHIDVNGLDTSIEDLGIKFGSTDAEMEQASATLFTFATSAGASKDKAVEFTHQVETLAARAISLNPQLGTLSDVTETLGPKLARGGRFAANFGLSLTAAEINTRALKDTGKTLTSELSVQEKAMAGAAIASERYGKDLKGTVEEGSKNAAVQARALSAEFKQAIEQIGVPLVSPVLDLIKQAIPDAVLIAQDLGHLAGDILPVVSLALDAISVPLKIIDFVLGEIPGPVVTAAAAFLGLGVAVEGLAVALPALAVGIDAAFPEIAVLSAIAAAALGVWQALSGDSTFSNDVTAAVDSASKGFADFESSAHDVVKAEIEAAAETDDFAVALQGAGVTSETLAKALVDGGDAYRAYTDRIVGAAVASGEGADKVVALIEELKHLQDQTEATAKSTLDSAVVSGTITQAEEDQAIATAGLIDGKVNYAAALDVVQPKIKKASDAAAAAAQADADAADATQKLQTALDGLAGSAPAVAAGLDAIHHAGGPTATTMLDLAVAIDGANLSGDELAAVAGRLGVTVDTLKGFVKSATKDLNDFVDAGLKGLPTVASSIDAVFQAQKDQADQATKVADAEQRIADAQQHLTDVQATGNATAADVVDAQKAIASAVEDRQKIVDEAAKKPLIVDPAALAAEVDASLKTITDFNQNIEFLQQAHLDNLAQIAAQRGPEFAAGLVNAINSGDGIGEALDAKFGELNKATADEGPILKAAGAQIVTATGQIAADAAASFGAGFSLVPPTQVQINAAKITARDEGVSFDAALADIAGKGAVAYQKALSLGQITAGAVDASGKAVSQSDLPGVAKTTGTATAEGFGAGFGTIKDQADSIISTVGPAISAAAFTLRAIADTEGFFVGYAFTQGMAAGIGDPTLLAAIDAAAANAVDHAVTSAKIRAGIQSPSTVMIGVGKHMGEGLALGIAATEGQVRDAASRLAGVGTVAVHADISRTVNLRRPLVPAGAPAGTNATGVPAGTTEPGVLLQVDARGSNPTEVAQLTKATLDWGMSTRGDF